MQLSFEQQEMLLDIIRNRHLESRCHEIARDAPASIAAFYAGGVVGNGTSTSCTEAAFNAALVGGGAITFNCGGPKTITFTTFKEISADNGGECVAGAVEVGESLYLPLIIR